MDYLAGTAPPEIADHIVRCPACAAEVKALGQVSALFSAAFYRADCPTSDKLLAYQAGRLTPSERELVAAHLKTCQACSLELVELDLVDQQSVDLSVWTEMITATQNFKERLAQTGKQILLAMLMPGPTLLTGPVRGGSTSPRVYQAGEYRLILACTPPVAAEDIWQVEGQLIPPADHPLPETGLTVQLIQVEQVVAQDTIDEFGYFVLEQVRGGHYQLHLELVAEHLLIEEFKLP